MGDNETIYRWLIEFFFVFFSSFMIKFDFDFVFGFWIRSCHNIVQSDFISNRKVNQKYNNFSWLHCMNMTSGLYTGLQCDWWIDPHEVSRQCNHLPIVSQLWKIYIVLHHFYFLCCFFLSSTDNDRRMVSAIHYP